MALFKKQSKTILLYCLDEYSKLNNILANSAVEDGPWKGYTRKLALTELLTYGKTYMMFVQTQHKLGNMNVDMALGD